MAREPLILNMNATSASDDDLDLVIEILDELSDKEFIDFMRWWNYDE